jgi:hypothetical protein
VTDDVDAAVADVVQFYRVFHSMLYLSDRLVFWLQQAPAASQLAEMKREFADILIDGKFELFNATTGEATDPDEAALVRLVFHFNRRNHGRLRMLIDLINANVR